MGEALAAFMRQLTSPASAPRAKSAALTSSTTADDVPFTGPWASGAPAITAYAAGRLGADTTLVAGLGRDHEGDIIRQRLRAAGVNCRESGSGHGLRTATAHVTYFPDGRRAFTFDVAATAAAAVTEADLADLPEAADWLHLSGSALLFGQPLAAAAMAALRRAHAAGARVSVDPNVRVEALTAESAALVTEAIGLAGVVFPSAGELATLGLSVARLTDRGTTVCATDGARGCSIHTSAGTWHVPAVPAKEVDADGAGDTFAGGYIAAALAGADPLEAASTGARAAAESIAVVGPMQAELTPLSR
ncbi:carbohydrate kinase family protein [Rugosimonospora africana]|uniref:carbohydrate kinase family protein n=1 Tax=Rugosimonospora africana TaxID=556532 RepID=UPI00194339EE|nr:PfkB family carbohydrate kinase [Rugosimonospora africana]